MCIGITHTQFETIRIPETAVDYGIPLGQGQCKAVILSINGYQYNSNDASKVGNEQLIAYIGDRTRQELELSASGFNLSSPIIFCRDLSEVYVRGNGNLNYIQVVIYLDDNDVVTINKELR